MTGEVARVNEQFKNLMSLCTDLLRIMDEAFVEKVKPMETKELLAFSKDPRLAKPKYRQVVLTELASRRNGVATPEKN